MSCTAGRECFEILLQDCAETVVLPVLATQTEKLRCIVEFAGMQNGFRLQTTQFNLLTVPARLLNESYTHEVRFYRTDGTLYNNRSYILKTVRTVFTDCCDDDGGTTPPVQEPVYLIPNGTDQLILSTSSTATTLILSE